MYTSNIKRVYIEVSNGVKWSYSNKWLVVTLSLCIVIGVNELGADLRAMVPDVNAEVEYTKPLTAQDIALIELDEYITMKGNEIYTERTNVYKEMARHEASRS